MVSLGPVSSLFDFLTFFTILLFFNYFFTSSSAADSISRGFQTAWFIESLCSQILVVFVIRTRRHPFWKSKPSKYLIASSLAILTFALVVPYTPLGEIFLFEAPNPLFFVALAAILGSYLLLAEVVKNWFYKRHAYRIEQTMVPKRTYYVTRTAKMMQEMIATISLRAEDEFSIESLTDDLNSAITYPINSNQMARNLQYLRRSGLISVDWSRRTVKREKALDEYIKKSIIGGPMWPNISEEWRKINNILLNKHGAVNAEYQPLLPKQ
jgi:hypothetical protein